ncbi:MAG: hypothetical protein KIG60_10315 [Caryophanon sp.]|nr:hypothetical protein [Caryophanon sp.]
MKKRVLFTALTATLMLAACSEQEEIVVTSDLGDVTQQQFYEEMLEIAGPSLLEQVVTKQLLEDTYSVSSEHVDEEFESLKASYGDTFAETLEANGMTESSLRQNIYFSLLRDVAVKESGKTFEELMHDLLEEHNVQIETESLQHVFDQYKTLDEQEEN